MTTNRTDITLAAINGKGTLPQEIFEDPRSIVVGRLAGRLVSSSAKVLPSRGSWPVAGPTAGIPAVPGQRYPTPTE